MVQTGGSDPVYSSLSVEINFADPVVLTKNSVMQVSLASEG